MSEELQKKVFISYCWTSGSHQRWVLELAERLVSNGVDVVLDKWDLQEGQDKYEFMESMVQDVSIDKVLIICDKGYKEKADERTGGVGTETQIITPMLYSKTSQTKFIPIIAEKGEQSFDDYVPNYLKSRIGIVMSCEELYMEGFEKLLRAIYDKPLFKKPRLGKMPSFLLNESKVTNSLHFINESLKKHINDGRKGMIEHSISDFRHEFFEQLNNFIINYDDFKKPYDEQIVENIDEMKLLRDEYLILIENLICGYDKFNEEIIIEIFEELYSYTEYKGEGNISIACITEHYKFFITELFIWTNLILYKYRRFDIIKELLHTKYFVKSKYRNDSKYFSDFRFWLEGLEHRNNRLELNRLSLTADKLVERSNYNNRDYKVSLIEMDLLLHYVSKTKHGTMYGWFPVTYIYKEEFSNIEIISKMVRKKYFEDIKKVFDVEDVDSMKSLIEQKLSERDSGFIGGFRSIPMLQSSINIDEIGTL